MDRTSRFFAAITIALACAASSQVMARIESLTLDPPSPNCEDEITVSVEGNFPNTCFHLDQIEFGLGDNILQFSIRAHENVNSDCLDVLVPYEAQHTVGLLEEGDYFLVAQEFVTPTRATADLQFVEFTVCCAMVPEAVSGLKLAKTDVEGRLRFSWVDVAGAAEYVIYSDDDPGGAFVEVVGTARTGQLPVEFPTATGTVGQPQFYLVAGQNGCAEGPKR